MEHGNPGYKEIGFSSDLLNDPYDRYSFTRKVIGHMKLQDLVLFIYDNSRIEIS